MNYGDSDLAPHQDANSCNSVPLQHSRNIPLIYANLVQFEICNRKEHAALAAKIRANPNLFRSSSSIASELTLSDVLYMSQVLDMWAHMSKEHRSFFLEMVVVESSIARVNRIRTCDCVESRAILKQDANFYHLSDKDLDKKIDFFRNRSEDDVRRLFEMSVKYQGYYMCVKQYYQRFNTSFQRHIITFFLFILCSISFYYVCKLFLLKS